MVAGHLGGGEKIGYRKNPNELGESIPIRVGDYFFVADYRNGRVKRWLLDFGVEYRGHQVEVIDNENQLPAAVVQRFYG